MVVLLALGALVGCSTGPPAHVVVVGGGPAGMAAALEAGDRARVTLVEGEPSLGGAGRLGMGVTAVPSQADLERWDLRAGGSATWRTRYVERVGPEVLEWLGDEELEWYGMDNTLDEVRLVGPVGGGAELVRVMVAALEEASVTVRTGVRVSSLARGDRWSVGLADGTVEAADAVVLATGGYMANLEMVREVLGLPDAPLLSSSPPFADGNGHALARSCGGVLHQPSVVLLYAHGVPAPGGGCHMLLNAGAALAVDASGARLPDFDNPRGNSGRELLRRGGLGWAVMDAEQLHEARLWDPIRAKTLLAAPIACKYGPCSDDPATLEEALGLPAGAVTHAVHPAGAPPSHVQPLGEVEWYAGLPLRPTAAKGLSGISTDDAMRVVDASGQPVPGLYAAGELAGFGHPYDGMDLDSTMVAAAILTGREAGRTALRDAGRR